MSEVKRVERTWFVTLTLSPHSQFQCQLRAEHRLARSGVNWHDLNAERQFTERSVEVGREATLWLKRVRKNTNASLRYILVTEKHKSGLPHLHALVHEAKEGSIRARDLTGSWHLGFSQCKLVAQDENQKAAAYICKYLSKDCLSRVRASQGYGQDNPHYERLLSNLIRSKHMSKEAPTPQNEVKTPPDTLTKTESPTEVELV
jgi:hypothetical protein